jgi:hypothetical protein
MSIVFCAQEVTGSKTECSKCPPSFSPIIRTRYHQKNEKINNIIIFMPCNAPRVWHSQSKAPLGATLGGRIPGECPPPAPPGVLPYT